MIDREAQDVAMNSICHNAQLAALAFIDAAMKHERPSAVFRPAVSIDGNQWCALYGANLQDGVAGFGDSPALAMADFDTAWVKPLGQAHPTPSTGTANGDAA